MSTLFAWDAVTTDHRLSGSNNRIYFLMVLEAGSPSSRCWQSSFLLRGILLDGWWMSSSTLFTGSSVCVCVPTHLKDTSHIGLGPTLLLYELILTNYVCSVPNSKVTFWGPGKGRNDGHMIQPSTWSLGSDNSSAANELFHLEKLMTFWASHLWSEAKNTNPTGP